MNIDEINAFLKEHIGISIATQKKLLLSLLIIIIFFLISRLLIKILYKRTKSLKIRYRWKKIISYSNFTLTLLLVANIWIKGIESIFTYFGLLSAGIAIALKDILTNFAGWIFILIKRPFEAGDRVEIGDYCGDVIDLRVFQFTLLELGKRVDAEQSTGRIVHIPNSFVFLKAQINFNKGFTYIWNEIPVLITFESNWQKAKRILERFLNKQDKTITETAKKKVMQSAKKYLIFYNKLTPIVYTSVKDSGILLTARYLCDPKKKRITEQNFWENILKSFAKNKDIDLAYPTQRIYMPKIKKK